MELFYKELGSEGQPIVILHGLFGSSDNWLTIGKQLAQQHRVFLIDQRNHGQSPWSEEWDYEAMSADLWEFFQAQDLHKAVVVGHSMGGKTAMWFATRYYPSRVDKLVVVDISPRAYRLHNHDIAEALAGLDLPSLASRKAIDDELAKSIPELGTRQFLLKNLYRTEDDRFAWRMNLPVIQKNLAIVMAALPENLQFDGKTLFIAGEKSDYIQNKDLAIIQEHFPDNQIVTVAGAGHWVHAEKPAEVLQIIQDFVSIG
ncbi:MAG: alpha/beta fold hydrolase [Microscillaceae bacterium]|nr:alpha/beta fold hydrolase [Microscillaceae bacterium]